MVYGGKKRLTIGEVGKALDAASSPAAAVSFFHRGITQDFGITAAQVPTLCLANNLGDVNPTTRVYSTELRPRRREPHHTRVYSAELRPRRLYAARLYADTQPCDRWRWLGRQPAEACTAACWPPCRAGLPGGLLLRWATC